MPAYCIKQAARMVCCLFSIDHSWQPFMHSCIHACEPFTLEPFTLEPFTLEHTLERRPVR